MINVGPNDKRFFAFFVANSNVKRFRAVGLDGGASRSKSE